MDIFRQRVDVGRMRSGGWVSAVCVGSAVRSAAARGVDLSDVLARCKLPSEFEFEHRVPITKLATVWEALVERTGDRFAPGRAAVLSSRRENEHSLLAHVCAAQAKLLDGLRLAERYYPVVSDMLHWRLEIRGDAARMVLDDGGPIDRAGWRHYLEFEIVDFVRGVDRASGGEAKARAASFTHRGPEDVAPYAELLGFTPTFCAERTLIEWPREMLEARSIEAKPALARRLEPELRELLRQRTTDRSTSASLHSILPPLLRRGAPIEEAARRMGVSSRSLERTLAAERTTYRAVLDDVRRGLAEQWLGAFEVAEVAARLGYSDARAFDRAFKRWTGTTPTGWVAAARRKKAG